MGPVMRGNFVLAGLAAWFVFCGSAQEALSSEPIEPQSRVSSSFGIERLSDVYEHWPMIVPGIQSRYFSSFDREGGNRDGFVGTDSTLYVDDKRNESVIFEARAPGCVNTIWFTGAVPKLRFYFDGEEEPRMTIGGSDMFSGNTAPFLRPLVFDNQISTGGWVSWVPLQFSRGLKITTNEQVQFYIIQYDSYPANWDIESWTPATDYTELRGLFSTVYPEVGLKEPEDHYEVPLKHAMSGERAIRELWFRPMGKPSVQELAEARIRIWWDGEKEPSVNCPLGMLFGSGWGEAPVRSLAFCMADGLYVCRFPMPFWVDCRIEVTGIEGRMWVVTGPNSYNPGWTGYFHAVARENRPVVPREDFEWLNFAGTGKVVGHVLSVQPDVPHWWEGDLRCYVDGKRTMNMHGTGHEDDHLGGWSTAWQKGPYTLPMHGLPRADILQRRGKVNSNCTMYRLWPGITFLKGIQYSVEHGTENNVAEVDYAGTVFFYALRGRARLAESDQVDVCDDQSRHKHGFTAREEGPISELTSAFEGREYEKQVAMQHRSHGDALFRVRIDPENHGVFLRRVFDQAVGRQTARIVVDGKEVGIWYVPEENRTLRWAERDYLIPSPYTRGKSSLTVQIQPIGGVPWDAGEYRILTVW